MDDLELAVALDKKIRHCNGKFGVIIAWLLASCATTGRIKRKHLSQALGSNCATLSNHLDWLIGNQLIDRHGRNHGRETEYSPTELLKQLLPGDAYEGYEIVRSHYKLFKIDREYCEGGWVQRTKLTPQPLADNPKGEPES